MLFRKRGLPPGILINTLFLKMAGRKKRIGGYGVRGRNQVLSLMWRTGP